MISSFICATYFVVIRIVDHIAMPFFRSITTDEAGAMAVSDFSVMGASFQFRLVVFVHF